MAKWVNLDDCVEISIGDMNFYPVELLGDVYEDVAPVVHAHWVSVDYHECSNATHECSNCHADREFTTYEDVENNWKYCGHCGAKMDEEDS